MLCRPPNHRVTVCQMAGCRRFGLPVTLPGGGPLRGRFRELTALCPDHAQASGWCRECLGSRLTKRDADGVCGWCRSMHTPIPPVYFDEHGNPMLKSLTVRAGQEVRPGTVLSVDRDGNAEVFAPGDGSDPARRTVFTVPDPTAAAMARAGLVPQSVRTAFDAPDRE